MIQSMTGYGEGRRDSSDGTSVVVRMKSVNGRGMRIILRSGEPFPFYEAELKLRLSRRIERGTVEVSVDVNLPPSEVWSIDETMLERYASVLKRLSGSEVDFTHLLSLPGVVRRDDERLLRRVKRLFVGAASDAIRALVKERKREGSALASYIGDHIAAMKKTLARIERVCSSNIRKIADRISERLKRILGGKSSSADSGAVLREAALIAERSDISEEVARLKVHLAEFEKTLKKGGVVGLRLDVLAQEMQREASTIAAKYAADEVSADVVDLRTLAISVRQQVQNIE